LALKGESTDLYSSDTDSDSESEGLEKDAAAAPSQCTSSCCC